MKGILLAGGSGTRLHPSTKAVSKHLLAVYDKPLIYYPLSVLMLAGVRDILIITTRHDQGNFQRLLGDGSQLGLSVQYEIQEAPEGIAQAFVLGADFIGASNVALALGDNIFFGHGLQSYLQSATEHLNGATIFGYRVRDPERYGVVEFDAGGLAISLVEKPTSPKSNYAVTGLYFYDNRVVDIARRLTPSSRNELEITDVNLAYLGARSLRVTRLGRGIAWLDAGTHEAMFQASSFVQTIQERQGLIIACIEEIAYRMGYISRQDVEQLILDMKTNAYARYLVSVLEEEG